MLYPSAIFRIDWRAVTSHSEGRTKNRFLKMERTMHIATCCSTLSFKSCVLLEECLYSCMNDSTCSLSTHIVVSATWSSSVMLQITRQHTAFYCDLCRGQDIVAANDLVARRQRAKPNLFVNSKPMLKHPWNPTVRVGNPDNTCDVFAREQSAHTFHSPMPHLSAAKLTSRVRTYVATGVEQEICVFRFGQVDWTVRKAVDLAASGLPNERRGFVHQKLSKRLACARKVEEVYRMYVRSNLSPSRASANSRNKKKSRTRNSTSRFNWHISRGFPFCRFLGAAVLSSRRRFFAGDGARFPGGCSTKVSFLTTPSSLWTCPDSILFAADLVCTMVVGERDPSMVAVQDTTISARTRVVLFFFWTSVFIM
jgi:hypothetical protein